MNIDELATPNVRHSRSWFTYAVELVYMWMWVRLRSGGSTPTPPLRTHLPPQTWQDCAGKVHEVYSLQFS